MHDSKENGKTYVNEAWRRLRNEELHSLYRSPNIKSRRLRWADHVSRMVERRSAFKILRGKPIGNKETFRKVGVGVDGRTILEWSLKKQVSIR
jgi:hypothetical protein